MVDYISKQNDIPICTDYDDLRQQRMQELIYPVGILITANVLEDDKIKEDAVKNAIPEFLKYNIVENEVRNVI